MIRQAAREACAGRVFRRRTAAVRDFTPEVVEAIGQGFVEPLARRRMTAANVAGKIKHLVSLITKAPQLWTQLKKGLFKDAPEWEGLRSIPAFLKWLPHKVHDLSVEGAKALSKFFDVLFSHLPLAMLTAGTKHLLSVNDMLNQIIDVLKAHSPQAFRKFAQHVGGYVKGRVLPSAAAWAKENLPTILRVGKKILNNPVVIWAIYWFIWFNVAEFEWDAKALAKAAVGAMSFEDLWVSLPGSAIGRIIAVATGGSLGNFALLPYVILARIVWALGAHYLEWNGGKITPNWTKMEAAFGLGHGTLEPLVQQS